MKYEFIHDDTIIYNKVKLTRIRCIKHISHFAYPGKIGGYIENENNLSHEGNCWVGEEAKVYGTGRVMKNAQVRQSAQVFDGGVVTDDGFVNGRSIVCSGGKVCKKALVEHCGFVVHGAVASQNTINITGFVDPITVTDDHITVGTKTMTFDKWVKLIDRWQGRKLPVTAIMCGIRMAKVRTA